MRSVIVNSRGKLSLSRVRKERRDVTPILFDFSLLFDGVDEIESFEIDGDAPVKSSVQSGKKIIVTIDSGQAYRVYDLAVIATAQGETRSATIQVEVEDRERGQNSYHTYRSYGYGYW